MGRTAAHLEFDPSNLRVAPMWRNSFLRAQVQQSEASNEMGTAILTVPVHWALQDLNLRPFGCDPNALPAELNARRPLARTIIVARVSPIGEKLASYSIADRVAGIKHQTLRRRACPRGSHPAACA